MCVQLVGWLVTGYPWAKIDTPAHQVFLDAFEAKYGEPPKLGAVVGHAMIHSIAAMLERAGSTETDAMIEAMAGLEVDTPFGPITWRGLDHQATMGAFVGRIAVEVRNKAFLKDELYALLERHGAALATLDHPWMPDPEDMLRRMQDRAQRAGGFG